MRLLKGLVKTNAPLIHRIKRKLGNVSQGNMTIAKLQNTFTKHWDELQVLEGIPQCTCGAMKRCSCNLVKKVSEIKSRNRLMQLLVSLNDKFQNARSRVIAMDPLPPLFYNRRRDKIKPHELLGLTLFITVLLLSSNTLQISSHTVQRAIQVNIHLEINHSRRTGGI